MDWVKLANENSYAFKTNKIYSSEDKLLDQLPNRFTCNRTGRGFMEFGTMEVSAKMKSREFDIDREMVRCSNKKN